MPGSLTSGKQLKGPRLPVLGGTWLDDRTRPPGAARLVVNVRRGEVRPGSLLDSTISLPGQVGELVAVMPGGIYRYRTPHGVYVTFVALVGVAAPYSMFIVALCGARIILSTAAIGSFGSPPGRVMTWAALDNQVIFAGCPDGIIGTVAFGDDGIPSYAAAEAVDRTATGYGFGVDDVGPYRMTPPRADFLAVHQGRVVVAELETGRIVFSNAFDPNGWPYNNFFRLGDGLDTDKPTALASVAEGRLVVGQRYGLWDVDGLLIDLATTTVARRSVYASGPLGPGSVQVIASGRLMYWSQSGPALWFNGTYYPAASVVEDIGTGPLGLLCSRQSIPDLDIDHYRPLESSLAQAVSRFSPRDQVYEIALGATTGANVNPDDRRLRLRCDVRSMEWMIEVHPPTRALGFSSDGPDDEEPIRGDDTGRLFFEGVGDADQHFVTAPPLIEFGVTVSTVIPARLQVVIDSMPLSRDIDHLWMSWVANHVCDVEIAFNHDGDSSDDEQTIEDDAEDRDIAFSSDGSGDGFTLGTDKLESTKITVSRRGATSNAGGRQVRVEFRTPAAASFGARWALRDAHASLNPMGSEYVR